MLLRALHLKPSPAARGSSAARPLVVPLVLGLLVSALTLLGAGSAVADADPPPGVPTGAVQIPFEVVVFSWTYEDTCFDQFTLVFDPKYGDPAQDFEESGQYLVRLETDHGSRIEEADTKPWTVTDGSGTHESPQFGGDGRAFFKYVGFWFDDPDYCEPSLRQDRVENWTDGGRAPGPVDRPFPTRTTASSRPPPSAGSGSTRRPCPSGSPASPPTPRTSCRRCSTRGTSVTG